MDLFTGEQIRALLSELSERLEAKGKSAEIFLVGGAAMALAYDQRRSTQDLDGAFAPTAVVRAAAAEVALEHGLNLDWLNDAAKGFLPGGGFRWWVQR